MKVIQLVTRFDLGGAERIAINIAKSKHNKIEYHMVEVCRGTSEFSRSFIEEMEDSGIVIHRSKIRSSKLGIICFPFWFLKLFNKIKPNVIHTHTEIPDLSLFLFCVLFPLKLKGVKIYRTLHNTLLWNHWATVGLFVEKFMIKKNANISNSHLITNAYENKYSKVDHMNFIYNGFDATKQIEYKSIVENKMNILFAGRFVSQKGIDTLIEIIQKVDENQFHFHIAGKGPLEYMIIDCLSDKSNVSIIPPIFNLPQFLSSFDYVLIPSIHEGLNSLSIEASFNGVPVIINNIDGLNETLPSDWPLKVENNNIEDYLAIFKKLNFVDRKELNELSLKYVEDNFSINSMQNSYESLYLNK